MIVDTSGPALRSLVDASQSRIDTLRMDGAEAERLAGRALDALADTAGFARELVARGTAEHVIVARGADGSVLATEAGAWHAVAPPIEVVSKVGAGDSFVGAYTLSRSRGEAPDAALTLAVAAASAACATEGTQLCEAGRTRDQHAGTVLTRL